MTKPIERDRIYCGRRFQTETIELCVRWYITYRLSYRDLAAMMAERGIVVSHTTIMRWVLRYVPEYERRWSRFAQPVNSSWRMDETAVRVRGGAHYLYRAVDKRGKSVGSLLCASRDMQSSRNFFLTAVAANRNRWPSIVNIDGNAATRRALRLLGRRSSNWRSVTVRCSRYLNNLIEQDHRAIKRRCAPMLGLKSFATAAITLAGIELAHRIRKRQFLVGRAPPGKRVSMKEIWDQALSQSTDAEAPQDRLSHRHPPMHQISRNNTFSTQHGFQCAKPLRYARKIFDGRGLYQLLMPNGGRYWRYNYRFNGKQKTIALGVYPDVSLEMARARHQVVRTLLANGVDPLVRKQALSKCGRCRGWPLGVGEVRVKQKIDRFDPVYGS